MLFDCNSIDKKNKFEEIRVFFDKYNDIYTNTQSIYDEFAVDAELLAYIKSNNNPTVILLRQKKTSNESYFDELEQDLIDSASFLFYNENSLVNEFFYSINKIESKFYENFQNYYNKPHIKSALEDELYEYIKHCNRVDSRRFIYYMINIKARYILNKEIYFNYLNGFFKTYGSIISACLNKLWVDKPFVALFRDDVDEDMKIYRLAVSTFILILKLKKENCCSMYDSEYRFKKIQSEHNRRGVESIAKIQLASTLVFLSLAFITGGLATANLLFLVNVAGGVSTGVSGISAAGTAFGSGAANAIVTSMLKEETIKDMRIGTINRKEIVDILQHDYSITIPSNSNALCRTEANTLGPILEKLMNGMKLCSKHCDLTKKYFELCITYYNLSTCLLEICQEDDVPYVGIVDVVAEGEARQPPAPAEEEALPRANEAAAEEEALPPAVPAANQAVAEENKNRVEEFIKNIDSVDKIKELALRIKQTYNKDFNKIDIDGVKVIFHWGKKSQAHAQNTRILKNDMKTFLLQQILINPNILDELVIKEGGGNKNRTYKTRTHKKSHKKHYKKILKNKSTYKVRGRNLRKTKWMH
jgi:hypothetical protein